MGQIIVKENIINYLDNPMNVGDLMLILCEQSSGGFTLGFEGVNIAVPFNDIFDYDMDDFLTILEEQIFPYGTIYSTESSVIGVDVENQRLIFSVSGNIDKEDFLDDLLEFSNIGVINTFLAKLGEKVEKSEIYVDDFVVDILSHLLMDDMVVDFEELLLSGVVVPKILEDVYEKIKSSINHD